MKFDLSDNKFVKKLQLVLLVVILGLALWSQPWKSNTLEKTATISVTGEATVEAVPDDFAFYPYFEQVGTNTEETKEQLLDAINKTIEELQNLGVASDDITLNADSLDRLYEDEGDEGVLRISLEIVVHDQETAQKVQDYLVTKDAKGQISPQATFSEEKQKALEIEATAKASEDARSKAEAKATLFDAEVGDVVTIDESQGGSIGYPEPYLVAEDSAETTSSSLPVLPGRNEYSLTINVTYELQ